MAKRLQNLMKLAVIAFAMLAISLNVNAQEWYVRGLYIWSPPQPQGTYYEHYITAESVTINGMEYHTIYLQEQNELVGAYRNEGNQVYYCKWNGSSYDDEVLFYDYDLQVGDFFNFSDPHPMTVTEVSTIIDNNGVSRKKISFEFLGLEDETEYWIEGVGSNKGFILRGNYIEINGSVFDLLCYHVDNDVIYINPEFNTCDIDEIDENIVDNSVNIYPNPASDVINILNGNNLNITSVEIIDLMGRTILSSEKTNIDISNLAEGQYFVKIHGETTVVKKLFIKK